MISISDIPKIVRFIGQLVGFAQTVADASGDLDIWHAMFKPILDAEHNPAEKQRLEALQGAVMLRIVLGDENMTKLHQNLETVLKGFDVAEKLNLDVATVKAMIAGVGLSQYSQTSAGQKLFNAHADELYQEFLREKNRLGKHGHSVGDLNKANYADSPQGLALKDSTYELHRIVTGNEPLMFSHVNEKRTVESNINELKSTIQGAYMADKDPRKKFQNTLIGYCDSKGVGEASAIRIRLGKKEILAAPPRTVARWKQQVEIKTVAANKTLRELVHRGQTSQSGARVRKELKSEINFLQNINKRWSAAKTFLENGAQKFRQAAFPLDSLTNEYQAILLLAAHAVKRYLRQGRGDEIKGMNVYALASTVTWDDIKIESAFSVDVNDLKGYFSEDEMGELAKVGTQLTRNHFNETNFASLSEKCDLFAVELGQQEEAVKLFNSMSEYFIEEEKGMLELLAESSRDLVAGRVTKGDEAVVMTRIAELSDQILALRKNRLGPSESTPIVDLMKQQLSSNAAIQNDIGAIEGALKQAQALASQAASSSSRSRRRSTLSEADRTKSLTIQGLEERHKALSGTIDKQKTELIKLRNTNFAGINKDLKELHERAGSKISDARRHIAQAEDKEKSILQSAKKSVEKSTNVVKTMFRSAAASTFAPTLAVKSDETKLSIIESVIDVENSLTELFPLNMSIDEKNAGLRSNKSKLEAFRTEKTESEAKLVANKQKIDSLESSLKEIEKNHGEMVFAIKTRHEAEVNSFVEQTKPDLTVAKKNETEKAKQFSAAKTTNPQVLIQLAAMRDNELRQLEEEKNSRIQTVTDELRKLNNECVVSEQTIGTCTAQITTLSKEQDELSKQKSVEEVIVELDNNLVDHDVVDSNHPFRARVLSNLLTAGYPTVDVAQKRLESHGVTVTRYGKSIRERSDSSHSSTSSSDGSSGTSKFDPMD